MVNISLSWKAATVESKDQVTAEAQLTVDVIRPRRTYAEAVTCPQRYETNDKTEEVAGRTVKQGTLLPDRFEILLSWCEV